MTPPLYQLSYQGLMKYGLYSGIFTSVTQRSLKEKKERMEMIKDYYVKNVEFPKFDFALKIKHCLLCWYTKFCSDSQQDFSFFLSTSRQIFLFCQLGEVKHFLVDL